MTDYRSQFTIMKKWHLKEVVKKAWNALLLQKDFTQRALNRYAVQLEHKHDLALFPSTENDFGKSRRHFERRRHISIFGYQPFRLGKVPLKIYVTFFGLGIPKNSPLYEVFMPIAWKLQDSGIFDHLIRQTYYYWQPDQDTVTPVEPLHLSHMLCGIVPYFAGLFIASMVFMVEYLSRPKKKPNIFEIYEMKLKMQEINALKYKVK